jgi:large subunit ribosomal protein L24
MAAKIKKGDRVVVLAGKDKGKQGAVTQVLPKENRVLVQGVNLVQRHTKATQADPQGGIKSKEATLHVSNVSRWSIPTARPPASASRSKATRRCASPRRRAR